MLVGGVDALIKVEEKSRPQIAFHDCLLDHHNSCLLLRYSHYNYLVIISSYLAGNEQVTCLNTPTKIDGTNRLIL